MSDSMKPQKIKIEKGYGITHALKKLVEDMKKKAPDSIMISDDKITLSEWNKTMDVLISIQDARKKEGKQSIFTGGTDKSRAGWQTSFVVHPDQEIEFTADEMKLLYDAMGVQIKASDSVEETGGADKAGGTDGPDDKKDSKQVAADTSEAEPYQRRTLDSDYDNLKKRWRVDSDTPSAENANKTVRKGFFGRKKVTYDANGQVVEITRGKKTSIVRRNSKGEIVGYEFVKKDRSGQEQVHTYHDKNGTVTGFQKTNYEKGLPVEIIYADKDGLETGSKLMEYDSNGNNTKFIKKDAEGNITEVRKYGYDSNGNNTKFISKDAEGNITYWAEYGYDSNGNNTKFIKKDAEGNITEVRKYGYDSNGNITEVREAEYDSNGNRTEVRESEYESNGNRTKYISKDAEGNIIEVREYGYDSDGNRTTEIYKDAEGNITYWAESEYDSNGNETKRINKDAEGNITDTVEYEYDSNGNTKYIGKDAEGNITQWHEFEYDSNGKRTKWNSKDAEGNITGWIEYEYDSNGNETKNIKKDAEGNVKYYFAYDENGVWTRHKPDGTLYTKQ